MFKRLSLRFRITLLVALILISLCVPMTLMISKMTNTQYSIEVYGMLSSDALVFDSYDSSSDLHEPGLNDLNRAPTSINEEIIPDAFINNGVDETEPDVVDPQIYPDSQENQAVEEQPLPDTNQLIESLDDIDPDIDQIVEYLTLNVGREALHKSLIIMALIVLIGVILAWFLMKHALQPVTKLSNQIADIDAKRLNQPLALPKTNDEIGSLTNSFNSMLSRINQSFEEQKRFSAIAAHELKTPLTAIMANIEVLEMEGASSLEEYREVLNITKENVMRIDSMVHNLLESYMQPDTSLREECNIRQISQNLVHLNNAASNKGVYTEIQGELTVWASYQLLERALGNIISNAYRYNKPNGHISISLTDNSFVIIDTGIGIPAESLGKLGEPFYRVDKSRSRELGGSGLGMAIAKRIFDAYQIKIDVESELGIGTTVTLVFPESMMDEIADR